MGPEIRRPSRDLEVCRVRGRLLVVRLGTLEIVSPQGQVAELLVDFHPGVVNGVIAFPTVKMPRLEGVVGELQIVRIALKQTADRSAGR